MLQLTDLIRDIPDFPKPGILFKDITPLLGSPAGLALAVEMMASPYRGQGIQKVCGAESRGFIFGTAIAQALSAGFVPIRKPGKLPAETKAISYDLEYGSDTLEIHADAVHPGEKILMVDDLLATGGTMKACCDLVSGIGAEIVGITVLIELLALKGREHIGGPIDIHAVLEF
ncbi:adenine phosphoribosyltransferase [Mucisphaera calidilacus]|uniref:Adenine phosphoribosyltransferase n=1 Tax=Mucisphaera calidilacus TaxID=2527982 RepID=A0A518C105_9BACT|nr:adenine phosphoribosyltransferase [Mucisphaera calidilacus]QDU72898.1 Adenine phosphoribosyltransferase [Mucisphaera calidilacus]